MKGGLCVANNEEVFSFVLEEVLSFEKGQEVGDMISVFLDPDISVQPFNEDISIRGMIELQGEYERYKNKTESDVAEILNADTFEKRNYVDRVVDIGEERAIFSHQFPVEITVPQYRVADMEDITMEIENFDYELIAADEIKVQSSIIIHGINREELDDDMTEETPVVADNVDERDTLFSMDTQKEDLEYEEQEDPAPTLSEMAIPAPRREEVDEQHSAVQEEREEKEEQEEQIEDEKQLHISSRSSEEVELVNDDVETDEVLQEDPNIDYLKNMFGGEEKNSKTMVRLCIVQERDTVDSIAEKYNVKKSHIIKQNRLEDESEGLIEGQLLHIPTNNHS